MRSGLERPGSLELPQLDDCLPDSADEQSREWGFPDNRPAVVAFIDVMTAALEAVLIRQELLRLRSGHGVFPQRAV